MQIGIETMDIFLGGEMMNKNANKDDSLRKIKKAYKPELLLPIMITLVCIAPYGHLWINIFGANYTKLVVPTILTGPFMIIIGIFWTSYFYQLAEYKREIQNYLKDPDNYDW